MKAGKLLIFIFIIFVCPKIIYASNKINDQFSYAQWYLKDISWETAMIATAGLKKEPVVVAVIDTGINENSNDLKGRICHKKSFISKELEINSNGENKVFLHGTFLASIIAANVNDKTGIAGVAGLFPVYIMDIKVGDQYGIINDLMSKAIVYAVDNGASVINLSFGSSTDIPEVKKAIAYANSHDVVIVAAAGNNNSSSKIYPAAYEYVISVGATSISSELWANSNYGSWVDVCAPGDGILGLYQQNKYGFKSGTSSATAIVSAQAAMIISINPTIKAEQVKCIIEKTTEGELNKNGKDIKYGKVNLLKSMLMALER